MENNGKMGLFLQNARLLSDTLGIVPLLYGSLGLEYLSGDDLAADDIDIEVAFLCAQTFLESPFDAIERRIRRIEKIS